MSEFGGNKFYSYVAWISKKKVQVFLRTYLSHILALALAFLALYREWPELTLMFQTGHVGFIQILILVIIAATIGAAIWELWGNKLTTSPQEIRFVTAMRLLLQELEKFIYGQDHLKDPDKRLEQFIDAFLEVTCNTLCGKKTVDGGVMLETPSKDIGLFQWSKKAQYPDNLVIPIPDPPGSQETGPAGVAYQKQKLVYMPKKDKKLGWPFEYIGDSYEPSEPEKGWIDVEPEYERFRAVLCLPIAIYQKLNPNKPNAVLKTPFGVLNYSTNSPDPFVDRDFVMGECFSSILALVMAAYRREHEERARKSEEHPAPSYNNAADGI